MFKALNVKPSVTFVMGDDCFAGFSLDHTPLKDTFKEYMGALGLKAKTNVSTDLQEVDFLSCVPYKTQAGFVMVRKVANVIASATKVRTKFTGPEADAILR
jgi:hypothetical protein